MRWLSLLLLAAPALAGDRKPNIVLVLVDDLGWTDLACMGSTYYDTPNVDRLAAEGLRFTQAYAAAAVCSPTRAAVMTGRHPARLGVTDWIRARFQGGGMPADGKNPSGYAEPKGKALAVPRNPLWLELDEVTLAEELSAAGYASCHVGKWHLGMDPQYPEHQGFDENHGGCDYGQPPSFYDPFRNKRLEGIPTLAPRREGEYLTDREADECVDFVRRHAEVPFFLYWAPYAVHTPIQAHPGLVAKYEARPRTNQKSAAYASMVESVDRGVGRLLETLEELELTGDTLIVFHSDNGGLLGPTDNAPLRLGKGHPYEGGIRVPLIVRWPGRVRVGVSDLPAISTDLLPTILAACDVDRTGERPLDGRSLWAHCAAGDAVDRERLVWHFPHYRSKQIPPFSVLREGDHKLLYWWDADRAELYDLAADISESTDLTPAEPDLAASLKARLMTELTALGARLPVRRDG